MKKAIITGITGQDGSYLAELLLDKGYDVHGLVRRSSSYNTSRIEHLVTNKNLHLHYCDLTDSVNLIRLVKEIEPDEIYNLGAQSHVKISWDCPEFTAETDALGTLRLLEAIRINGLEKKTRFYQASTSELYGLIQEPIQSEKRLFIRALRMVWLNYTDIGLRLIIARVLIFLLATVFCLIMKAHDVVRTL